MKIDTNLHYLFLVMCCSTAGATGTNKLYPDVGDESARILDPRERSVFNERPGQRHNL